MSAQHLHAPEVRLAWMVDPGGEQSQVHAPHDRVGTTARTHGVPQRDRSNTFRLAINGGAQYCKQSGLRRVFNWEP